MIQHRVLLPGRSNDWNIGIGILPECKKVLVMSPGSLSLAAHLLSSRQLQPDQRTRHKIIYCARMIDKL